MLIFVCFFPIKTQFYNVIYIVFDAILHAGAISSIYTYNYLGLLIGCQEILETQKVLGSRFEFFYSVVFYVIYIFSVVASIILFNRNQSKQNFKKVDWILLAVFSFQLFDTLEYLLESVLISKYYAPETLPEWLRFLKNMVIVIIAFVLFFNICNKFTKKQILMFALPASVVSFALWFLVLGPLLLPIKTL
ncbi:hypothetical protein ACFSQP_05730 [Bizionia sediminis]|uniref:Uncharacterized protein n=2 Tax=Bizionia sediminis TaxID=1737064 RepID=A0ABW5KQK8_9FLAO